MTINIEKLRSDLKWEGRKFLIQTLTAAAGLLAAGGIIGGVVVNWLNVHNPPRPVEQQFAFPPGTIITIPPAPTR